MTPEAFIPLADAKRKCGIPNDNTDLDSILSTYIRAAGGKIEQITRRNIFDRDNHELLSPDPGIGRQSIRFFAYDIKPISGNHSLEITYKTKDSIGFGRDGTLSIPAKFWDVRKDHVIVCNGSIVNGEDVLNDWPERDRSVHFRTELNIGMAEAPAQFTSSALMLVKEMQEGTLLDSLPMNIMDLLLKDYIMPAITANDELLYEAGI